MLPIDYFALDNVHGGYIATRHLLSKGHQHIACLCSEQFIDDSQNRLQGHRKAMAEAGIAIDERYIVANPPSEEGGRTGVYDLLAKGLPSVCTGLWSDIGARCSVGGAVRER